MHITYLFSHRLPPTWTTTFLLPCSVTLTTLDTSHEWNHVVFVVLWWASLTSPTLLDSGMSDLLVSLGHTGRRRVVLGHTLTAQTLVKTDEQKKKNKVLNKFMILYWAALITFLGCRWPVGLTLDNPMRFIIMAACDTACCSSRFIVCTDHIFLI